MFLFRFIQITYGALFSLMAVTYALQNTTNWHLTDTHIHALPPAYKAALAQAGGDPSGYPTPEWSINGTLQSMDSVNSAKAVLSVSTPGVPIAGIGSEARKLCREINHFLQGVVSQEHERLEFFGALPDWRDLNGTLSEIDFLFLEQKAAVGVAFYTQYGDYLPGDPIFWPIWKRLETYNALAFMHPGVMDVEPKFIGGFLPQPIIDYPQQTTRAAVDLVFRGTRSMTPHVDIILSHAGGTLPFLTTRALGSLLIGEISANANVNVGEAEAQFRRFYYDIALSTSKTQLDGLLDNVDPSHVLTGSDYPYAPPVAIHDSHAAYIAWAADHPELGPDVLSRNARDLLTKHKLLMAGKAQ